MNKSLDFVKVETRAKKMTLDALNYATKDCKECIDVGCNPDYYRDEMSVYLQELKRRNVK